MIVTKEPQLIDAKNGIEGIVFIRVANVTTVANEVQSNIELFTIDYNESQVEKAILDEDGHITFGENGMPVTEIKTLLVPNVKMIGKETAIFKEETFLSKVGHLKSDEFDKAFIKQMEFVNSFDWETAGKTPVRYWKLKAKDVKIISDEEFAELVKTKTAK